MTDLNSALWLRLNQIVQTENRPFSYVDFVPKFRVNGREWSIRYGTFRNKISLLCKDGKVGVAYYSPQAFYTLPGLDFEKPLDNHTGVTAPLLTLLRQQHPEQQMQLQDNIRTIVNHPVYRMIQNLPFDKNALHDIHMRFRVDGIWFLFNRFNKNQRSNPISKDIPFKVPDIDDLDIKVTVHHTDTVSIIVGCSSCPVAVDTEGVLRLSRALTVVKDDLARVVTEYGRAIGDAEQSVIPDSMTWTVTLLDFGADASIRYTGEKFFASWKVGQAALFAIYSKEWKGKRKGKRTKKYRRVRMEIRESPEKSLRDVLQDKMNVVEEDERKKGGT